MNLKKFRSLLLASVAAGFMITTFADSTYASRSSGVSSSKKTLVDEDINKNLSADGYAYRTPGNFTMRAKTSTPQCDWTLKTNQSASFPNPDTKGKTINQKFTSIQLNTTSDEEYIKAGIDVTLRPYITYIIKKDAEAFNSILPTLTALAEQDEQYDFYDKAHNPFALLTVTIERKKYRLFNKGITGKLVSPSTAFFYPFSNLSLEPTIASQVIKMINEEVLKATPKATPKRASRSSLAPKDTPKATPKKTPRKTSSRSDTPSESLKSAHKKEVSRRMSMATINETGVLPEEVEKDPVVMTPTKVPTITIPTGGQNQLADLFDADLDDGDDLLPTGQNLLANAFDDEVRDEDAQPTTIVTQIVPSDLPAPTVTVTAPEKEKKSERKKDKKKQKPKAPTEKEIQESVDSLIAETYPGLQRLLGQNESVSVMARDLLKYDNNDAKRKKIKFDDEIQYFAELRQELNSDDLSRFTFVLSSAEYNEIVGEAYNAFEADSEMKRFNSSHGTVFVRDRSGTLLVSVDGNLYDSEYVWSAIDEERARVTEEEKTNLKRAETELKGQNKDLITAVGLLASLESKDIKSFKFARKAIRAVEKESPFSSLDAILQGKLRTEVTTKS